jgi:hypothetical protein
LRRPSIISDVTAARLSEAGPQHHSVKLPFVVSIDGLERNFHLKRSIVAVTAVFAFGSAYAYAETPSFPQPSFKDYTDLTPVPATDTRSANRQEPTRANAKYAHSSVAGATRSDAVVDDRATADPAAPNLNDTFHYPTSN